MMLRLIMMAFLLLLPQAEDDAQKLPALPAWTSAPTEANLFVVKTAEFTSHDDAAKSLLPTVRDAVLEWAMKNVSRDCGPVIESMPLEDFKQFIHKNQEVIHVERKQILNESVKNHCGYVRVKIDEQFFKSIDQDLRVVRLKRRLCGMLLAALIVLGSLGILWCWFYMRYKSRGLYIKRIRWIVGGLVVALLVSCYLAFQMLF